MNIETQQSPEVEVTAYEAPQIESVLTPDDLEREVAYAGLNVGSGPQFV